MMQFKKILLCVHPEITDLDVVDHAARIARKFDARVRVMHTVSDYPEDVSEWWNATEPAGTSTNTGSTPRASGPPTRS